MAKINLLPWRQELKKQRQQEFIVINAVVALSAAAIIIFFHLVLSSQLSDQEERKAYIQSEIATLDSQIKQIDDLQARKEELLARMKVIQDLQGRRPVIVRVFDELARNMPNNVYLSMVRREGDKFVIEGYAESNTQVSSLLRNLNASTWFKNPVLSNVVSEAVTTGTKATKVSAGAKKHNRFALTVELEAPEPDPTEEKTGVSKTNKEASK